MSSSDQSSCWKPPAPFETLKDFEKYLKEYLHKVDVESIFDVTKWKYCMAEKVENWNFDGFVLKIKTRASNAFSFNLEIAFIRDNAVLIRINNEDRPKFKLIKPNFVESDRKLVISSRKVKVDIELDPFKLTFADLDGKVFLEEYREGLKRSYFPVFPLAYKVVGDSVHLVESFGLEPDEAVYGFGEIFSPLDKRGQRILSWNSDTTYTAGNRAYKCIPFYSSSRNYGVYVNFGGKVLFEVGSEYSSTNVSFEVWSSKVEYLVIRGSDLKEVISTYSEITGRPQLPPLWSFGFWQSKCMYLSKDEVMDVARKIRELKIPCDVIHIDPAWMRKGHYCDLEWDVKSFPNPEEMLKELDKMGFKISLWIQPYIPVDTKLYKEASDKGYFLKDEEGNTINIIDFEGKYCGVVDFSNPECREWYKSILKKRMAEGVRVFKTDMGEAIPECAVFHDGRRGIEAHNAYAIEYLSTVYEANKEFYGEGLVWGRPGFAGIQSYPAQWSGDSHSTYRDMSATLWGVLSYSMSGVPFWSHDIGGFQGEKPSPELYVRWSQWGLLSPLARAHGTSPREPWEYGETILKIFRKFDKLRYSLLPYIYSLAKQSCDDCLPMVRPMVLEFQEDPTTWRIDTQYMLGSNILVVPVLNEDCLVNYYLPRGYWADFWKLDKELSGGIWIKDKVPLSKIPLWVRENSIIPMTKPMQYVGEKSFDKIQLLVYPKTLGNFSYYFDGEEFEISFSRINNSMSIELGPSKKIWDIKVVGVKKPKGFIDFKWTYSNNVLGMKGIALERKRKIKLTF